MAAVDLECVRALRDAVVAMNKDLREAIKLAGAVDKIESRADDIRCNGFADRLALATGDVVARDDLGTERYGPGRELACRGFMPAKKESCLLRFCVTMDEWRDVPDWAPLWARRN